MCLAFLNQDRHKPSRVYPKSIGLDHVWLDADISSIKPNFRRLWFSKKTPPSVHRAIFQAQFFIDVLLMYYWCVYWICFREVLVYRSISERLGSNFRRTCFVWCVRPKNFYVNLIRCTYGGMYHWYFHNTAIKKESDSRGLVYSSSYFTRKLGSLQY